MTARLLTALELLLDEIEMGLPDQDAAGAPEYENIWRAHSRVRTILDEARKP